jgi:hypothetical protein
VVNNSIVAVVLETDHEGDEFSLDLPQTSGARHSGLVEPAVRREATGVERMDRHDVVDAAMAAIDHLVVKRREVARPLIVRNGLNPGHGRSLRTQHRPCDHRLL